MVNMISVFFVPILYVISIYFIPFYGCFGEVLSKYTVFTPFILGIVNVFVAFILNNNDVNKEDYIFTSAIIVKYSLIPFYIITGFFALFFGLLAIVPHLSFLIIGSFIMAIIGYILMLLGSMYQIAYICKQLKEKKMNVIIAIVMIIASTIFVLDVVSLMLLSLVKNKYRKLTILILILLFLLFVFAIFYLIFIAMRQ